MDINGLVVMFGDIVDVVVPIIQKIFALLPEIIEKIIGAIQSILNAVG